MKKRHKIIITIIICFLTLWTTMFITDYIRCKNDKNPCFSVRVASFEDGGSQQYIGLFYNYYKVVQHKYVYLDGEEPTITKEVDYVMTPWFFNIDYAKNKVFGE